MNNNDILLDIKDLEVTYDTEEGIVHAVNNISFGVVRGKTLGIVGETGAGKTTTAMSILRLLPERTGNIRKGSITYDGRNLLELPIEEMQRVRGEKISMIFQDPMSSLNPVITVGDQIAEVLQLHEAAGGKSGKRPGKRLGKPSPEIMKRVDEILEMVGIPTERKSEYPHQFSGGMKQRVVIAMALVCEPELVIADEPTTALDVTIQAQVLELISHLKEEIDSGIIMITHDLGVVASICDRIAIMYGGKIVETGTVFEIFEHPQHPYTIGLLSCISNPNELEKKELHPIPGSPPDLLNIQENCPFADRCAAAMKICKLHMPQETQISATHRCSCWLQHPKAHKGGEVQ